MKTNEDFREIDQAISAEIMAELNNTSHKILFTLFTQTPEGLQRVPKSDKVYKRMFFPDYDDKKCTHIKWIAVEMDRQNIDEAIVRVAEIERISGVKFCQEFDEIIEPKDTCGRVCDKYSPCNGKIGKCRHLGHLYDITNQVFILNITTT